MLPVKRARGQSLPEQGLLIALVVVMLVVALGVLSGTMTNLYRGLAAQLGGGATPTPAASQAPTSGPSAAPVLLSVASPSADQTITVSGGGFAPGSEVEAVLHSSPVVLGAGTADEAGDISLVVTIPADVDLTSTHYIALVEVASTSRGSGPAAREIDSAPITISPNPINVSIY